MRKANRSFLLAVALGALPLLTAATPRLPPSQSCPTPLSRILSSTSRFQEAGGEITKANWRQHPKIRQVRAVVQSVKAGLSANSFTIRKRAFEYCEPYEDTARTIATDSRGRVRFYLSEAGSEDSALKWEHYYDEAGRLRFVFITGGAANGSKLEHRIYFGEDGKRLWEEQTYTKGPGYTFPEVWPADQLQINDAASKYSASPPCPEIKRPAKRSGRN